MSAQARRDQLLDAALQIIARDGYGAVSIDAIARSLNVTRPVVYNVFTGLDDLLYALLDREEKRALEALTDSVSFQLDVRDIEGALRRSMHRLIDVITEAPMTWRLIFLASAGSPAAVCARVDRDRELVRRRVQSMAEIVLNANGRLADVDATVVSHALIALGEHFGRLILERPGAVDADTLVNTMVRLLATPVTDRRANS